MRQVFISDTHNQLSKINVPDGNVLIHCGDATLGGTMMEVINFNKALSEIAKRFDYTLFCPGNHDWLFQDQPTLARGLMDERIVILDRQEIVVDGVKFYGVPHVPVFGNWAFMEVDTALSRHWENIPDDTNVLITHGPPHKIMDAVKMYSDKARKESGKRPVKNDKVVRNVGSATLSERIKSLNLSIHAFGHIHQGYGVKKIDGVLYINAAILDAKYEIKNHPIVVDLNNGVPSEVSRLDQVFSGFNHDTSTHQHSEKCHHTRLWTPPV